MKKRITKSIIGIALLAGVASGAVLYFNHNSPVKEADAWAESPWYYIGEDTDWKWTDDNIFTLNESINRYYSPVITLSGQKFKLTLGTAYNTQISCDDYDGGKSVDRSEWGNYCTGTGDSGNFQFNDSGKKIQFWFTKSDMNSYARAGYAVHIEEYHEYIVTSGGSSVTLSRVSNDSNYTRYQGYLDLTKGQSVSLSRDGGGIDYTTQRANKNNIEASSKTILETATHCLITLRFQNSNNYYLHANGRTVAWYLVLDGTFHAMAVNTAESAGHYMYTNLELQVNQKFWFYENTQTYPYGDDFSQDAGLDFTAELGKGIKCNTAGTYNVYLDASSYNPKAHVGKQSEADKVALAYANYFLNQFEGSRGGVCNGTGSGDVQYEESLSAAWTRTSSNYSNGVNKNTDAKNIIKNADPHSDNVYGQFAALYDKVFRDYGTKLSLTNYAERTISSSGAAVKILPGLTNSDESTNIVMIVIVSSITAVSVIGFTFLRKRKEK